MGERYERANTIITSNLDIDEWPDIFPANRVIGLATIDRLRHGAYRIVLDGESYRTPRDLEKGRSGQPRFGNLPTERSAFRRQTATTQPATLLP